MSILTSFQRMHKTIQLLCLFKSGTWKQAEIRQWNEWELGVDKQLARMSATTRKQISTPVPHLLNKFSLIPTAFTSSKAEVNVVRFIICFIGLRGLVEKLD